jgi:hypothetical protein
MTWEVRIVEVTADHRRVVGTQHVEVRAGVTTFVEIPVDL